MDSKTYNLKPTTFPKILLVDMNSFFASVEQQANPFFRGRPLGVCASIHETSCLIATSKEAKALGIKTGTLIYKAKKICPGLILVQSEPAKYREVSEKVNKIFRSYTDQVEPYSIDESFLDLGSAKKTPLAIGAEIKQRIKGEAGEWLTCSIGVAPNKFMAKLAADLKKPDGLSIVWREHLPEIYKTKKLTDLWGISYGWQRRLAGLGLANPLQVMNYPVANLISMFGKPGFYVWQRISGLEEDEIHTEEDMPKSFGHSWVLNFRTTDKKRLEPVILRLAEKAARRMRSEDYKAFGAYLSVTLANGRHFRVSKVLKYPLLSGMEYFEWAKRAWKPWEFSKEVMHIAVGFNNLLLNQRQLSLFEDKTEALLEILDAINDKHGEFSVRSGLLTKTEDYAPDAIAFGR